MADLGTILVDGNGTSPRAWSTQAFGDIDEGIGSADGTEIQAATTLSDNRSTSLDTSFTLAAMPGDFDTMDSISYNVRYRAQNASGDDTLTFGIRIVTSGGTVLAAADSGGTFQTVQTGQNSTWSATLSNSGATAFTYTNTTATATNWNDAQVEFRSTHSQSMAADDNTVIVDTVEFTGTYTAAALETGTLRIGMISWWDLEETSGTRSDAHGSNDLTDNNTVGSGTGVTGDTAADFERTNSEYLLKADATDFDVGDDDLSIVVWINPETLASTAGDNLFFLRLIGDNNDWSFLLRITSTDDTVRFGTHDGTTTNPVDASTFGGLSTGTWYMVYAYHDATANEAGISINDGTVDTVSFTGGLRTLTDEDLVVGANWFHTTLVDEKHYDGLMDSLAIWNRVLTSSEVTELYNSGNGLQYADTAPSFTPQAIIY